MNTLKAGPLSVGYENGFLRRISYGKMEIVRMIYFALRDHNWNTLAHQIENEVTDVKDDSFEIRYDCIHINDGQKVVEWKARVAGMSDGTITFEINGRALENFRKNRAGFCILHPLNILGSDCRIQHPDGVESVRSFPQHIAAENPFKSIQAMIWQSAGVSFRIDFEGDVFETEDQRNWGDASFKTFCTPLEKPFPVELKEGETIFQRVTLKPPTRLQTIDEPSSHVRLRDTGTRALLPSIGVAASTQVSKLSEAVIKNIRAIRFSHYRLDLYPSSENFATDFSNGYENAYAVGLPLEVVLHLTENFREELEAFTILCKQNKVKLKKVTLLQVNKLVTGQQVIDQVPALKSVFPNVSFGAGSNYNFNEINKNRFDGSHLDFVSFSMDPQEHAVDDLTILENSSSPEYLVQSVKAIYGDRMAVHLSPLALRKRFNPYATNPSDFFIDESAKADPRQKENLAAAFAFASLCSLAKGKASAVTYFQTTGDQGLMTAEGELYPAYLILKNFALFQGKSVSILDISDPLAVAGILLDGKVLALYNLSQEGRSVRWEDREYFLGPLEARFESLSSA